MEEEDDGQEEEYVDANKDEEEEEEVKCHCLVFRLGESRAAVWKIDDGKVKANLQSLSLSKYHLSTGQVR